MTNVYHALHSHSVGSVLDGFSNVEELCARAKANGQIAVSISDHGNMFMAYDLYKACKKHGLKPIFANETYIAPGSNLIKEKIEGEKPAYHVLLIAYNDVGYKNLCKITTNSWVAGKYYKPRTDMSVLSQHKEGIICLSACIGGQPQQYFLEDKVEKAEDCILAFKSVFGQNYFLELTHTGLDEQTRVNNFLIDMARKHDLKLVVTPDSHYTDREDSQYHAALVAINTGNVFKINQTASEDDGLAYQPYEYYLKSYEELWESFKKYHGEEFKSIFDEACANTNAIAEQCNVHFREGMKIIPQLVEDPDAYVREHSTAFLTEYLRTIPEDKHSTYWERLDHEIEVISKMEFSDYFVMVHDYVKFAQGEGILTGPGRGSAAGSLLTFCLRITLVDPIKYNLLFSRMLNRGRAKRPRIEIPEYTFADYTAETGKALALD